ncbi:MAG: energy-coupling factor transporter transmembrane component T family protein [Deltaproteobacteria bacterium]
MDIGLIDYFANSGGSFLHRASPSAKLGFTAIAIASIIAAEDFIPLACIYLTLAAITALTRLPFIKILSIAAYPAIFALLFALTAWRGDWTQSAALVLKALDAALLMTIFITTTPYPAVFARISSVLPKIVAEGLFMTYRSLFILLGLMDNLLRALTVRGGFSPGAYLRNTMNFASGIGLLLIKGFDLSEKMYGVMKIRGYEGRLSGGGFGEGETSGWEDAAVISIGCLYLGFSLAWRAVEPSWEVQCAALAASAILVSGISIYRAISRGLHIWKR